MSRNGFSYSNRQEELTALISYLALTNMKSRSAAGLASSLGLEEPTVQETLDEFPGIFRRSKASSKSGKVFYTLHVRYATRYLDDEEGDIDSQEQQPLAAEYLTTLLEMVSHRASQELTDTQITKQIVQARNAAWIAAGAAILATIISVIA